MMMRLRMLNGICPRDPFSTLGSLWRRYIHKKTVGKEMILLWSVEFVPETPMQNTLLVNWPPALGPGSIPTGCFPLSLAKSRSNHSLGCVAWKAKRRRGCQKQRASHPRTWTFHHQCQLANEACQYLGILPSERGHPSLAAYSSKGGKSGTGLWGWTRFGICLLFWLQNPCCFYKAKLSLSKNQGMRGTDPGNDQRWLFYFRRPLQT